MRTSDEIQSRPVWSRTLANCVPEVERAYYQASVQELLYHDAHYPIIIAATHWCIRVRHHDAPPLPLRNISRGVRLEQSIRVIDAAIERRVIVDRGYRKVVVGFWRAAHSLGQYKTQSGSSSHYWRVKMLMSSLQSSMDGCLTRRCGSVGA